MGECPHHSRLEDCHKEHYNIEKTHDHRITVIETMAETIIQNIKDIRSTVDTYGIGMVVTLLLGFVGIIVTIWMK